LLKVNFFFVLDRFDALISKIIFKKLKKKHFDTFWNEKQPQPHSQTNPLGIIFMHSKVSFEKKYFQQYWTKLPNVMHSKMTSPQLE
jgi:hypothetical protein